MKKSIICVLAATLIAVMAFAGGKIENQGYVRNNFKYRIDKAGEERIKVFFDTVHYADDQEREAIEFLYAYMPLPDMMNYSPDYHLQNVRLSLKAQREMPWGDSVPAREFLHFVIPARVNNEDLDGSRGVFYQELRDRVKGLSMRDAVLEVNHWCHEKATYRPSDSRTSSPLSTVSQAIGRCGEESTFAVAALRSVGIPARQVYTPRWAHTDDNHAWVEAWADGGWWFLGACEPEPMLNMAWFNSPASRGMLMTTKAYGDYHGPEEKISRSSVNTEINVTANYAPVRKTEVNVVDSQGKPIDGAKVIFSLYNYAEYYPVAVKTSNHQGQASLVSGIGDMVVWAADSGKFGVAKASADVKEPVKIIIDKDNEWTGTIDFDITPPQASGTLPKPDSMSIALNDRRKQLEDSIRNAYMATFATAESATRMARKIRLDADSLVRVLTLSRGNHTELGNMLLSLPRSKRKKALTLLLGLADKDLRDIPTEVIKERLDIPDSKSPLYRDYVLCPRVEFEGLVPFVKEFLSEMKPEEVERYRSNPASWVKWISKNISLDRVWNPGRLRMHPLAVWRGREADALSRSIFFVASARAMGIPSRIDAVTGKTQWHNGIDWIDVTFDISESVNVASVAPQGEIKFVYSPTKSLPDPKYYIHFSISKIENGSPRLLEFPEDCTLEWINRNYNKFDVGQYILTSGQRLADGSVLARSQFFRVSPDSLNDVPLVIRQDSTAIQVIGSFNSENLFNDKDGNTRSLLSATGRGYYVLIYGNPNHEPTSHVLNEICAERQAFVNDGRKIMLIYGDPDKLERARLDSFPLPSNVVKGSDTDGRIIKELTGQMNLVEGELPVVVVADTFNRVVFCTQGYSIGTASKLLDILSRLHD